MDEDEAAREAAADEESPARRAAFLRMREHPLEMFPDPVLPDDGLERRAVR